MGKEPLLPPEPSPIAGQPAVAADDPVTGDNDRDRVAVVGLTDGPS
jgi:hypothetical protein